MLRQGGFTVLVRTEPVSVFRRRFVLFPIIAVVAFTFITMVFVSMASVQPTEAAENASLLETGSSLLYPLFNAWLPVYHAIHSDVRITTQSTGSGTGISQALGGLAQIGASDAYLPDGIMRMHSDMLNIPLTISSQMVNYNLPGLNQRHIRLSGPVLAGIYEGSIRNWNDKQIAAMNPGVTLPSHTIIPIHRSDGSGDTFIYTQYLAFSDGTWANKYSYGTTISWAPVPGSLGADGNPGMLTALQDNPYSVAYIGSSYEDGINKARMGTAMLKNHDSHFVLPTSTAVKAAADAMVSKTPTDERVSLIFALGAESYPIINYEYAIVKQRQPSRNVAQALRTLFNWAISPSGGNAPHFMEQLHFVALPPAIVKLSAAQIAKIQ